jgi:hypothetical protein
MICTIDAAVSPFQAVSNRGETDKSKTILKNLASVSLFQRTGERCPRNSNGGRLLIEFAWAFLQKTVKRRNRQRFTSQYQCLICFTAV